MSLASLIGTGTVIVCTTLAQQRALMKQIKAEYPNTVLYGDLCDSTERYSIGIVLTGVTRRDPLNLNWAWTRLSYFKEYPNVYTKYIQYHSTIYGRHNASTSQTN